MIYVSAEGYARALAVARDRHYRDDPLWVGEQCDWRPLWTAAAMDLHYHGETYKSWRQEKAIARATRKVARRMRA